MKGLPSGLKVHFGTALVDMRKGIDSLRAVVDQTLRGDPYSGHLFVFVGKSKDKVKILFWDKNGFVVYLKRLEQGRFQLPVVREGQRHVDMDSTQLAMFLDGIDLNAKRLARWSPSIESPIDGDHRS